MAKKASESAAMENSTANLARARLQLLPPADPAGLFLSYRYIGKRNRDPCMFRKREEETPP